MPRASAFATRPPGRRWKDAIFRIYSMTKPLTSVAAMTLMEDGRLQLTDPVSKYLPEFKDLKVAGTRPNALGEAAPDLVPRNAPPRSRISCATPPASPMARSPPTRR